MVIELRLEGALAQVDDLDAFLEWLESFMQENKQQLEIYQDEAFIKICPYGDIHLQWEGKYLTFSSDASMLGAGYYDYVYHLLRKIQNESEIEFELYDPCNYHEQEDFETLKFQYFYPFLSALKEVALSNYQQSPYLCFQNEDYLPMPKENCAVTMMGYLPLKELKEMDMEAFSEAFYIWNEKGLNANFYRNCAQALLWNRCYFEYSNMNGESMKAAEDILSYLETAYEKDNTLPLFMHEYQLLCDALQVKPLIPNALSLPKQEIGYRNQLVLRQIEGWNIWLDGMGTLSYDKVFDQYNFNAPYMDENDHWNYFIRFDMKQPFQLQTNKIEKDDMIFTYDIHSFENEHELIFQCQKEEHVISFQVLAQEVKTLDMILDWLLLMEYHGGEA